MREIIITTTQDFIEALEETTDYLGATWYRGHANATWRLIPGYHRLSSAPSESTLMKRFKQSAAMLISATPQDSFDWLFLMQHYGVPTRLLDWSENPLVGLYFAVSPNEGAAEMDAALWALRPSMLNTNAGIIDEEEEHWIPSFEEVELTNYSTESVRQNKRTALNPVGAIATRNSTRIQAQHGVFTIHHNSKVPIEDINAARHVDKYIIPRAAKERIYQQLQILGFTKFQLFPELASIGEVITGELS